MKKWYCAGLLGCVCLFALTLRSQTNEFAVVGSSFQTSASFNVHGGEGFQINYARRVVHIPLASLYFELPFAAAFGGNRSISTSSVLEHFLK